MIRLSRRRATGTLAVALVVTVFQSSPSARHSWRGYHWARTANPFTVKLGDNVSSTWDGHLTAASADWSQPVYGNPVITAVVAGGGGTTCEPTLGQDEICNASYGNTGWLGIAQIWISGGKHITQGRVKLNETYFNTAPYNTSAWRQFVMCQEVGHTFGLDHQNTNFYNLNLGSCMDYTNDPDGAGLGTPTDNTQPNQHDYEQLASIYSHVDSFNSFSSSPAASRAHLDNPSEWGQLMSSRRSGRSQVFERDFGNGQRVVTFVIWA